MPVRTVIIHAGPPKTGTTTIQSFMFRASTALSQAGILYANAGRLMAGQTLRVRRPTGWMQKHGPGTGHHLLPWTLLDEVADLGADECWAALIDEFRIAQESVAVVSSEAFSRLDRTRVDAVRGYLAEFNVLVVAYVRSPFSRMLSDYTQRVKSGRYHRSFGDFVAAERELLENYDGFLETWGEVFGSEQIHVRDFELAMASGSLELDFAGCLTAVPESLLGFLAQRRLNESPDDKSVARMRRINLVEESLGGQRYLRKVFAGLRRLSNARIPGRIADFLQSNTPLYEDADQISVEHYAGARYAELVARAAISRTRNPGVLAEVPQLPIMHAGQVTTVTD